MSKFSRITSLSVNTSAFVAYDVLFELLCQNEVHFPALRDLRIKGPDIDTFLPLIQELVIKRHGGIVFLEISRLRPRYRTQNAPILDSLRTSVETLRVRQDAISIS